MDETRIGFAGGGSMAEAMIRGLVARGVVPRERIAASARRTARAVELRERWGIEVTLDNRELVSRSDVVVLSVKPQGLPALLEEIGSGLRGKLAISVAAGVRIAAIESRIGRGARVVRAMPNTAVLVDAGATALARGEGASEEDLARARRLFDAVGVSVVVDEEQLDAVTALSGSGPAYAMLIVEAMSDAGVKAGLSRAVSQLLAAQTLFGSARLLLETGEHPAKLREMVTSPGGTAITGLHVLEERGVRAAIVAAVEAAARRAGELGAKFPAYGAGLASSPGREEERDLPAAS